jgi:hypothetical protein
VPLAQRVGVDAVAEGVLRPQPSILDDGGVVVGAFRRNVDDAVGADVERARLDLVPGDAAERALDRLWLLCGVSSVKSNFVQVQLHLVATEIECHI